MPAEPPTLAQALAAGRERLAAAGVDSPVTEARLLFAHATGLDRTRQLTQMQRPLLAHELDAFEAALTRRANREPLAYIRGHREFYGLDFLVSEAVLIPRPETELIVDLACNSADAPRTILDIATGSGCLLATLLHHFPQTRGTGTDISPAAIEIASVNLDRLGVANRAGLRRTSWAEGIEGTFDLIVSNPPYIPSATIDGLDPEVVRFEPALALDGGADGLDPYRAMTPALLRLLAPKGRVLLELGQGQADELAAWFGQRGFTVLRHRDLAGIERVIELMRT